MKRMPLAVSVCACALLATSAEAADFALTARASTLGFGLELTAGLTDRLNARVGGNTFSMSRSFDEDGDEFEADLKLRSITALLDVHPFGGGFRLSGGYVNNGNEASLVGESDSYDLGNNTYTAAQVGALTGTVDFNKAAAYAGIGWGNAVREGRRVGVVFDLGVVFQGSPDVTLRASGPISGNSTFQQDLRSEELNFEEDAKQFKYFPVISLGISYKF